MARKTKDNESPADDQAKASNATVQGAEPTPVEAASAQAGAAETGEGAKAPTRADASATSTDGEASPSVEGEAADTGAQAPPVVASPAPLSQDEAPPPLGEPDPADFVVVVVGPKRGRWRAGRRFGPEETRIPVEDLSEAQKMALLDDPALIVSVAEVSRRP